LDRKDSSHEFLPQVTTVVSHINPIPADSGGHALESDSMRQRVSHAIEHALHYLPSQGPIAIFVHHNTLHAFEHLPFEQAVIEGLKTYQSQPYLSEEKYREEHALGRITDVDLEQALRGDLGARALDPVVLRTNRFELRRCMLGHVIRNGPDPELRWFVAETNALQRFREDVPRTTCAAMVESVQQWWQNQGTHTDSVDAKLELAELDLLRRETNHRPQPSWSQEDWSRFTLGWLLRVCRRGASVVGEVTTDAISIHRHRDILLAACHFDCDVRVHELLIRFLSSMTDQGFSQWELPNRQRGIYGSFLELYAVKSIFTEPWKMVLADAIADDLSHRRTSMDSIEHSLAQLGVSLDQVDAFLANTLLALPGWTGMIWQLETNAEWTPRPASEGSLVDLLAVRLLLDRASIAEAIASQLSNDHQRWLADHGYGMDQLAECLQFHEHRHVRQSVEQRAFILFQLAQLLGWSPNELNELKPNEWQKLMDEISDFGSLERRRLFHLAYERNYRIQVLDAIASQPMPLPRTSDAISFQLITCIDDREESLRRSLEEIDPRVETFGVAGFFAVPMYYRSASDAHYIPLCPVVIKPQHFVDEIGTLSQQELQRRQAEARRVLGYASHRIHLSSRSMAAGFVTSLLGSLASLPMVARVLAPRLTAQVRSMVSRVMRPNQATTLCIERIETTSAKGTPSQRDPGDPGLNQGFTHAEMANMVERLLGDLGLKQFSRLVLILGHGSSSLNNPHESAYNCGACGGGRGGPNARAFALMANDYRVRRILEQRGTLIPESCVFVGGYHNTCTDSIEYFEVDRLPPSHQVEFLEAQAKLEEARRWNARERARRFQSAPWGMSPDEALKHVEGRAEDLAQARPEYNHATHAACIVGRRSRTRGLFMDRRAFLTSYDPTTDGPDFPILNRILQAVIPVCSGISLEYYFSTVDNVGYGCGSKLPHNITSLLGVMEGAASDLRTGLSQQMVEIHEPMRIVFVIENTPEAVLSIMARNPNIDSLIRNRWVQIATLSPTSNSIHLFESGRFVPYEPVQTALPRMPDSYACFRDRRGHLPFATIAAS
jgi:uncharacterized protein